MLTDNPEAAKGLIISHAPVSIMSESYRAIRTSLLLSQAEKPPQVILLTSPSPGEGKTLTSTNLAIALAHDGHSVLLIDGDLRRGRCHGQLGLRSARGLSNVLTGGLDLEESIQSTAVSGLSFLSRGASPPNPSELLGSQKMKEVLKKLKEKFEFIVIDSPPVMALSDAAVLSVLSDGVLLIFDGQKTSTANAQRAVERLEMVKARLLGVILNGVNLDDPQYSYYYDYYSYFPLQTGNDAVRFAGREAIDASNGRHGTAHNGISHASLDATAVGENREPLQQESKNENGKSLHAAGPGLSTTPVGSDAARAYVESESVSPEFMKRLLNAMLDAVGPVAPLILRDHIALLGESQNAFPRNRVDELVKLIAPEILHRELRARFQKEISEEIRNLGPE